MTISSVSSANFYYTNAVQSAQVQNSSKSTETNDSTASITASGDSIEISSEAYARYNASKSQGAPPPPPPPASSDNSSTISDILDSLVEDGTITSDQKTAIASALTPSENTDEDSKISYSDSDNPMKTALDSLIDDGTITSDQATSILSALAPPEKPDEDSKIGSSDSDNPMKTALGSLVDDRTITSDQLSSILSAIFPGN